MTLTTIESAAQEIRDLLPLGGTHYFILAINDCEYKIRVSDHSGRAANNWEDYDDVFSFITSWCRQDRHISNEYIVDEDGCFGEMFMDIEECLDFHIN